ncbi:MAG: 1-deoxy-D-xylulose-5-phosphate synthase [archaeon]|nr:1-deoxy-D-xylulose-5-phosphate synthase [archaeon]
MSLLQKVNSPKDIKQMNFDELNVLSEEIRNLLIDTVSETGGHLASNLGIVELTLALHKVYNMPKDKIIWDVGHQTYVHKIITGRRKVFDTLRQRNGLSGFPKRNESPYDTFDTGHSSTSISAALGLAKARRVNHENYSVVAVIGDGALTGGMAFEALNDAGRSKDNLVVILNDNEMSIEKNVGGLSQYLTKVRTEPSYAKAKRELANFLNKIPTVGSNITKTLIKVRDGIKYVTLPSSIFEELGFTYIGPIDGHNIELLCDVLGRVKNVRGPVLVHVVTKKGKGYTFAEEHPEKFHSISPFNKYTGETNSSTDMNYSKMAGKILTEEAKYNNKLVAVSAAMIEGTGLSQFKKKYPDRTFDVGIAEQHAVTFAAGLATAGLKPVVAIYSTFLQRAYDQIIHDVALQKLPVVFLIDRAGIVGADGETHQGIFDVSFLSHIPNMKIMMPRNYIELEAMMRYAFEYNDGPIAIRYPRGEEKDVNIKDVNLDLESWDTIVDGEDAVILTFGNNVSTAVSIRNELKFDDIDCGIVNARLIKPLDMDCLTNILKSKRQVIILEDNIKHGGLSSLVLEKVNEMPFKYDNRILSYAIDDKYVPHGNVLELMEEENIDKTTIVNDIIKVFDAKRKRTKK